MVHAGSDPNESANVSSIKWHTAQVNQTQSTAAAQNQNGVAATQTYKTRDEAAKAAEKAALTATDKAGRKYEYGAWITLKNADGQYTYTIAVTFKDQGHFYSDKVSHSGWLYKKLPTIIRIPTATEQKDRDSQPETNNTLTITNRTGYVADTYSRNVYRFTPGVLRTKGMSGAVAS